MTHGSLKMNVIHKITKKQSYGDKGKKEILVQKIKVKKYNFDLYILMNESNRICIKDRLRG